MADAKSGRIEVLDENGGPVRSMVCQGRIIAMTVDRKGRVYAATDVDTGSVQVFGPSGESLGVLRDQDGFGEWFSGIRSMNMGPDDTLLFTAYNRAFLFQVPGN
ncbi:MAG TPA: hypothetical protein VHE12_08540 [bacterium]|nr:hypothetical protein [bacterium]